MNVRRNISLVVKVNLSRSIILLRSALQGFCLVCDVRVAGLRSRMSNHAYLFPLMYSVASWQKPTMASGCRFKKTTSSSSFFGHPLSLCESAVSYLRSGRVVGPTFEFESGQSCIGERTADHRLSSYLPVVNAQQQQLSTTLHLQHVVELGVYGLVLLCTSVASSALHLRHVARYVLV